MLRDTVLMLLKEAGGFVSGEEMSRSLGVSRMTVSHAVRTLRDEGYVIDAVTNRGYCLRESPDSLTAGDVLPELPPEYRELVRCMDTVDSTNTYLKQEAMHGAPHGLCAIANEQTAGRGRVGRTFYSARDCGIYLSVLLRPHCTPAEAVTLTAQAAVAVCRAIRSVCGVDAGIKWTNDIVLGTRKVCGILTEMTVEGESGALDSVVIGIGVNVNQTRSSFPPALQELAGSVFSETGVRVRRALLAAALIRELAAAYAAWEADPYAALSAYRALCMTTGHAVYVLRGGAPRSAFAEAVTEDFGLRVRYGDGTSEVLRSGEVSVRGLFGYT